MKKLKNHFHLHVIIQSTRAPAEDAMLRTTINMHNNILEKLITASRILGKSRREILVQLIMRMMRDIESFQKDFSTVRYQPDDPEGRWHCLSIQLRPDENEYCVDLRKACKCSVSLIVAIAVDRYLDTLIKEDAKAMHNYARYSNYVILRRMTDGIVCWQFYWGFPTKHLEAILGGQNAIADTMPVT